MCAKEDVMKTGLAVYLAIFCVFRAAAAEPPVAVDDLERAAAGSAVTFDYLHLNDSDPDGDSLTMAPPTGWAMDFSSGFIGNTNVDYVISDGTGFYATGTLTVAVNATFDVEAARDLILSGVTNIASGEGTGKLAVYGPTAYAVNWFEGAGEYDPMVGIASWGNGRVIAMPDHQMLEVDNYGGLGETARFVRNGLEWLSGTALKSISIVTYQNDHRLWLMDQGYSNVVNATESTLVSALSGADVFFAAWLGSSEPAGNLVAIGDFVKAGGGLFICDYGEGYEDYWWNSKKRYEAPGNVLLREAGLGFCNGMHWVSGAIPADNRATSNINIEDALAMLQNSAGYTAAELQQGGELLSRTSDVLPPDDLYHYRRDLYLFTRLQSINPTPSTPVSDPFEQSLLKIESDTIANTLPAEVTAHRTGEAVYGSIDPAAPRVTGSVLINASRSRWQATGFYAVPGELVTVTVPPELVGQGYHIRVNAHTDNIQQRSSWERFPYIHRSFEITAATTQVANAFGGSIFIDLRGGAFDDNPPEYGMLEVTVSGAVRQPWFDLYQHSDADWNTTLRDQPGLYAVLVSSNHVITLPKFQVESANLTEPTRLMTWWHNVVGYQDWLAGYLKPRTSGELANVDVQISAGSAHSGYPFQAYMKYWGNLADIDNLSTKGTWGDFHELGHNHQRNWWKFDGDTEVTVNVFSTLCLRTLCSDVDPGGWGWTVNPVTVIQRANTAVQAYDYLDNSSVSDRLAFWIQLVDGFGWHNFQQVLEDYEHDNLYNPSVMPANDQEDMEQWLVRFSNQVGYDMTGFMVDTWGLPIGSNITDQISHLPDWMPVIGGLPDMTIPVNKARLLDFNTCAYSMDGTADLIYLSTPENGKMVDNGDGTWSYEPDYNFLGTEQFVYTLQSSAGNTQTFTNTLTVSKSGVYRETWYGISGNYISNLTGSPNYPDNPDVAEVTETLTLPVNAADAFGTRQRTLLCPQETGSYTFWLACDDYGKLYLSSTESPDDMAQIAYVDGWTSPQQWDRYASQQSAAIDLVAGRKYYLETLQKEGGGGDHLAVAWQTPSNPEITLIGPEFLELPAGLYAEVDNARTWAGRHGLSGDDLDEDADPDGDTYTNLQEFEARTNPAVLPATVIVIW